MKRYETFTADDIIDLIGKINAGTEDLYCRDVEQTPDGDYVCQKEPEDCEACFKAWLEEEI